ncbi:Autophagy protein 5 [Fusarium falciforme]|nr:Autophagy protein 5 [Fusarium falciforme]
MSTYAPRHAPSAFTTPAATTLFRRLTWEGTVPLEIRVGSQELLRTATGSWNALPHPSPPRPSLRC